MSKVITCMSGGEMNIPSYYTTKMDDGKITTCLPDSECDKVEWTTAIDSYEGLVSMIVREEQAHTLADALNNVAVREIKVVQDLRRALLAHLERDLFEGDK